MTPRRLARIGFLVAVPGLVIGCASSHQLAMDNRSGRDLLVRVTETQNVDGSGDRVTTFQVAALTIGDLFPKGGGLLTGTVELLSSDCQLLGTTDARGGAMIEYGVDSIPSVHALPSDYDTMGLGVFPIDASDPCGLGAAPAVP
jgi:hypothetical protein